MFVYICIVLGDPVIRGGDLGIPLTGLTPPHFCGCPNPGYGFPTPYVVFFYVQWFEVRGVVVCFVDIDGIVDHHCLTLLFIIQHQQLYRGDFFVI